MCASVSFVLACSSSGQHGDLKQYIAETKARPAGAIEPLPSFKPYEAYIYSAAAKRSPFDRPLEIKRRIVASSGAKVTPDFNRTKEFLEGFDLATLKMVGNIEKGGTLWALISDPSGTIHWVKDGNFIGKNHGKIVETVESKVELIEIVSDGLDGWVERPRVIALSEEQE
ncbi:MAG: pilus assembly protein PilP [Agarilytica sp.]